jgi:endonuclease-8
MPEGDTIYRAARTLSRALSGQTVERFETVLAQLARVDTDTPLRGRTIDDVSASGKQLIIRFSGDLVLRTHMRMNGSWHIYRPGERWRRRRADMRMALFTKDWVAVGFNIPVAELHDARSLSRQADIRAQGPDLLGPDFDVAEVVARVRLRPGATAAEVLLNQRIAAGIGNVYKSETLFLCGIDPFRLSPALSDTDIAALYETARRLMKANVVDGTSAAIVTYTGPRRTTHRSSDGDGLWVYGRRGEPCRKCGAPIEYTKRGLDARSTYWCPKCQAA